MCDWQERVATFVDTHGLTVSPSVRLLDLSSEVGELAKVYLTATEYTVGPMPPSANWEEELGDVLFALLCLAHSTGVDMDAALTRVLNKYAQRLSHRSSPASGR